MNAAVIAVAMLPSALPAQVDGTPAGAPDALRPTAPVASDGDDLLQLLPADAWAALAIRDLAALDEKVASLGAWRLPRRRGADGRDLSAPRGSRSHGGLGVDSEGGLPLHLLALLKHWLGIVEGFDDHGSAAVVVMPVDPSHPVSKGLAILLPITDRLALMTLWDPHPIDQDCFKITLAGRESFLASKGKFCVIGPDLDTVRSIIEDASPLKNRQSPQARARYAAGDVCLWINLGAIASSSFRDAYGPRLRERFGLVGDLLRPYGGVQVAGRIARDGLTFAVDIERTETHGKTPAADTSESLLRGLPDEPFVLAMGVSNDGSGDRLRAFAGLVAGALTSAEIVDASRTAEFQDVCVSVASKIAAVSVSASLLPEGADGLLGLSKVIRTRGDSRVILREIETTMNLLHGGMFTDPKVSALMQNLVYRRAAEACDGITIDHLLVDQKDAEAAEYASLRKAVGREGLLLRIGAVDHDHIVATLGGGLPRFKSVTEAVRSGGAPLVGNRGIVESARHLAPASWLEAYFSVTQFARLASPLAAAMGMPKSYGNVPELAAPIAVGIRTVSGDAAQVDIFIPKPVLTWLLASLTDGLPGS